ncbi:outer membrane autotransporter protein [Labrenzia sp. MBR-25]
MKTISAHCILPRLSARLRLSTALCAATLIVVLPHVASAATFTVTEATDDGSGTVAGSLSWAIASASASGDVIEIDPAVSTITVSGTLPAFAQDVTVRASAPVEISGSPLAASGTSLVLSGVSSANALATALSGTLAGEAGASGVSGPASVSGTAGDAGANALSGSGFSLTLSGSTTGGNGGAGGSGGDVDLSAPLLKPPGDGGDGGNGAAAFSGSDFKLENQGAITGGSGGNGGRGGFAMYEDGGRGGNGGAGGAGIAGTGLVIENSGTITGGAGGHRGGGGSSFHHSTGPAGSVGVGAAGITGSDLTIVNKGTISGGLSGGGVRANAIEFTSGINILELRAGSTITGNVVAGGTSDTLVLGGDTSPAASFDAGEIGTKYTGFEVLSKTGNSTWTLTGTSTHTVNTTVETGTLQAGSAGAFAANTVYTVNGGTLDLNGYDLAMSALSGTGGTVSLGSAGLTVNQSGTTTYGGAISGTGSLTKSGAGTLTLTGVNTHTGGTTVSGGRLVVNGRIGATTLNGGTVGGSGTLGNVTANSGSTIAPGNSIGTLNVAGNVSFAAGSTYDVEVDSAGNSDKIAATGTVTIDSGAAVKILAENGTDDGYSYAPSTTYTIISAGTAVTGTFGTVNENFAFLDAELSYGATSVTLDLIRNNISFADVARTTNQRAVAGSLSGLASTSDLYRAVAGLNETQTRRAYDSLSGEIHASLPSMFLNDSARLRDTVTSRIHDTFAGFSEVPEIAFNGPVGPRGPGLGTGSGFNLNTWGSAYGAYGKLDGDGNAATLSRSTGGALVGLEATAWPQARFGLLAGLGQSQASVSARASSADANSYTLGAYGGVRLSDLGLTFGAAYSWHDVTSERAVAAGGLKDTLTADYWSRTAQVFGEASYALETPWLQVSPFAGLALLHQQTDAFQEQGSATLALTGDGSSQLLGSSTLGLRMSKTLTTTDGISAALTGALGWRHAIGDLTPDQRMALSGLDPFTVQGVPLDRDTALVEAGLALTITDRTTLGLSYQGAFGENARDQGANARVNIRF